MDIDTDGHLESQRARHYEKNDGFPDWFYDNEEELLSEYRELLHPNAEVNEDEFGNWCLERYCARMEYDPREER